jgi:hypothetical protein
VIHLANNGDKPLLDINIVDHLAELLNIDSRSVKQQEIVVL